MDRHSRRYHLHHQRLRREPQGVTVTEVVYQTLEPTFKGPVAGYSTVTETKESAKPTPTPQAQTTERPKTTEKPKVTETTAQVTSETKEVTTETKEVTTEAKVTTTSKAPRSTSSIEQEEETETETLIAQTQTTTQTSLTNTLTSTFASNTVDSALNTASSTPLAISEKDEASGFNTGSIAGIVGGCAAAALILLFIAAFFYRRRKQRVINEAYGKTEDEKMGMDSAAAAGALAAQRQFNEKAPRVSLRPVTQFNPLLDPPAASPVVKTGPSEGHGIARKPIPAPLALTKPDPPSNPTSPVIPAALPSPTLSAFSDGYAPGTPVPVDAAALVAGNKPAPVHRVQMDYIPNQPDELEIYVGTLVRLLHEYDDGWALCVRMDRSQQGVCPRTCLSARPVKPRPNPAPGSPGPNQQRRGPPPAANVPHPQNPASQSHPQSPAYQQRYTPYPGGSRPQTPKTSQLSQPVPQITVSPSEPDFPAEQAATQSTPATLKDENHQYHAM
ncbi:hypothetical protein BDZ91DRAFT_801452 [Kalaharituber pfeilii]|nr:hypothetical protein BDZ91DRAFT_801452 [Kalaharituber pfeilii]